MTNFKHSGKLGDIIWSIPFIQEAGGGILCIALGVEEFGAPMSEGAFNAIRPLLEMQDGILGVEIYKDQKIDCDLDLFRHHRKSVSYNLVDNYFVAFSVEPKINYHVKSWLRVDGSSNRNEYIVVSRTSRYLNSTPRYNKFYERLITRNLAERGIFLGFPEEHDAFQQEYGVSIPFHRTANLAEAALIIKNAEMWIGNENLMGAIAEGLKKTSFREIRKDNEEVNCLFERPNLFYF